MFPLKVGRAANYGRPVFFRRHFSYHIRKRTANGLYQSRQQHFSGGIAGKTVRATSNINQQPVTSNWKSATSNLHQLPTAPAPVGIILKIFYIYPQSNITMIGFLKSLLGGGNFSSLVKNGAAVVDVRTGPEYDRGHVKGAMNIPVDRIEGRAGEFKAKNQAVICCCESGSRSGKAVAILKRAGVTAYNGGNWKSLQNKLS